MTLPLVRPTDDRALLAAAQGGDEAAWATVVERHGPSLLSFCRHMLGSRQDAEDALQHVLLDAFRALGRGPVPEHPRGWLFTIARNRCTSMLRAHRPVASVADLDAVATEGLGAAVEQREDLRQLLADVARLPEDQRAALLLAELHDDSHQEIASTLGVRPQKVKALVFQARSALIADRDARAVPCDTIREELATARGAALRRRTLRRHVAGCAGCSAYEAAVAAQRRDLALVLPVTPSVPLALLAGTGAAAGGGAGLAAVAGGGASVAGAAAGASGLGALLGGAGLKVAASALVAAVTAAGGVLVARDGAKDPERGRAAAAPPVQTTAGATATPEAARAVPIVASGTTTGAVARERRVRPGTSRRAAGRPGRRTRPRPARVAVPTPATAAPGRTATPAVTATPAAPAPPAAAPADGTPAASGTRGRSESAPGRTKAPGEVSATGRGQQEAAPPAATAQPDPPAAAVGQQTGRDDAPGRQRQAAGG